ncbi:MAG: M3 family oligoendopeptidase [Simkaniaceae bacterium]|nr:M3 family oligoendopeptidase [Simkaniaceae bacterium]MCF7851986.1 M3 family oligoendopeptidase [Simkaniaceae bacterium]
MHFKNTWDLSIFFNDTSVENVLKSLIKQLKTLSHISDLESFILSLQEADKQFKELQSYILCLQSENTQNKQADALYFIMLEAQQHLNDAFNQLEQQLAHTPLEELLSSPALQPLTFFLKERHALAAFKLPFEYEQIINALEPDGFHGFSSLYDHLKNLIRIPSYETKELLSYPEAENRLSDPNRLVRQHTHRALMSAFEKYEDLYAEALNHISGFRLKTYALRHWDHFLDEPLRLNRLSHKSLEALYTAIQSIQPSFEDFFMTKAQLLNIDQVSWYDIEAPIKENEPTYSFEEGAEIILKAFGSVSPQLKQFAKGMLESYSIDAQERPHKRAGGFCTSFHQAKQTRIFMSYQGTFVNIITLAHELGHAFHAHVTFDLPLFNQDYPMNLAEMASTMCEQIVLDYLIKESRSKQERQILLDKRVSRDISFLTNLVSRFYFECDVYEKRQQGYLDANTLSDMMLQAQKKAFNHGLDEYCPHFWASKLHFYFTDIPFYNFPYTFGFLFSLSTYLILMKDPSTFESRYIDLLRDTGIMTSEELAQKHLHLDLFKETFYQPALCAIQNNIQEYKEGAL